MDEVIPLLLIEIDVGWNEEELILSKAAKRVPLKKWDRPASP